MKGENDSQMKLYANWESKARVWQIYLKEPTESDF